MQVTRRRGKFYLGEEGLAWEAVCKKYIWHDGATWAVQCLGGHLGKQIHHEQDPRWQSFPQGQSG